MDRPTVTELVQWSKYPFGHPNRIAFTYERPMTDRELAENELNDYLAKENASHGAEVNRSERNDP